MATVRVGHHPELTADAAMDIFARHFEGTYRVFKTRVILRDFIVQKSGWVGVGVHLKQEEHATTFVFSAMIPNAILRAAFWGIIAILIFSAQNKQMEEEISAYIQNAPEFK